MTATINRQATPRTRWTVGQACYRFYWYNERPYIDQGKVVETHGKDGRRLLRAEVENAFGSHFHQPLHWFGPDYRKLISRALFDAANDCAVTETLSAFRMAKRCARLMRLLRQLERAELRGAE